MTAGIGSIKIDVTTMNSFLNIDIDEKKSIRHTLILALLLISHLHHTQHSSAYVTAHVNFAHIYYIYYVRTYIVYLLFHEYKNYFY